MSPDLSYLEEVPLPVRRDSRRNRAALIAAAREVMIVRGMDAPMKSIAHAAGLGSATLYRHFPTRADLVTAVFGDEISRCRDKLAQSRAVPDPWESLSDLLHAVAETELSVPGLARSLSLTGVTVPAYDALWAEARRAIDHLVARLHEGGARDDLRREDLWLLLEAVRATTSVGTRRNSQRLIALIIGGVRHS